MKNYLYLIGLCSFLVGMIGCQKEKLISYSFDSGITIFKDDLTSGKDSITLSFAVMAEQKKSDTVTLPLRIVGLPTNFDREVQFDVMKDATTADQTNYELLPSVIPANSYTGTLRVKVNKTNLLKTEEVKIWIALSNSTHFKVGPKEKSTYLIKVNDYLTRPASWSNIRFGDYSQAKYGLIIRETGYSDFSNLHPEVMLFIIGKCRNALNQYIQMHDKEMLDENELPVRFP